MDAEDARAGLRERWHGQPAPDERRPRPRSCAEAIAPHRDPARAGAHPPPRAGGARGRADRRSAATSATLLAELEEQRVNLHGSRGVARPLQVDRALEHDDRHPDGDDQLLDRPDRAARHLPRHPPRTRSTPGNSSYLLWMIMGFLVATAVLVVSFGRVGDIYGRVRMFTLGFAIFTVFSILLSVTWMHGGAGALWLIVDAHRPGRRRRVPVRQLVGDPDRRLPARPARPRARRQRRRRHRRLVHRPRARRRARRRCRGGSCSSSRCRSGSSARSGRGGSWRSAACASRRASTGGATSPSPSA